MYTLLSIGSEYRLVQEYAAPMILFVHEARARIRLELDLGFHFINQLSKTVLQLITNLV